MYGVGNRLDSSPELLFKLRAVDHLELIEQAIPAAPTTGKGKSNAPTIATSDLGAIFGIELGDTPVANVGTKKPVKSVVKIAVTKATKPKKPLVPKKSKRAPIPKKG
jgi:uncharacterized Zn finger protein